MDMDVPNRALADKEHGLLVKKDARGSRTDSPTSLPPASLKVLTSLFQPRFDSIAYAPGISEGHVLGLARAAKGGADLDPLTVVAFGQDWYLVDGHHRLRAYAKVDRAAPIPVNVLVSDLKGDARVHWAVGASVADNKKTRLNMSSVDKADGAWRDVKARVGSKSETAAKHGVSETSIAKMRVARNALEAGGEAMSFLHSWRSAQLAVSRLNNADGANGQSDFRDKQRKVLAKRLKSVMELHPSPDLLAEGLEAFWPGIVTAMSQISVDDGGGTDFDI